MNESTIMKGFEDLRNEHDYDPLYHSALCRAKADWFIGINAARLFSILYNHTLNVVRIHTPTLSLLVERDNAIQNFEKKNIMWCISGMALLKRQARLTPRKPKPKRITHLKKFAGLAGVHRIKVHALRYSHTSLLISMSENPFLIKERLGHEKIQTTLGTFGHLYPNSNLEVVNKLTGVLTYTPASHSITDYTSNQHTAIYCRDVE